MGFTGKLISIQKDWKTGEAQAVFSVNETSALEALSKLLDVEKLDIRAIKFRKKRSLDANAYLWVICTKIAEVVKSSKDEIYEEMLQKYGFFAQDDSGNYITVTAKAEIDITKLGGHWKFYKTNGKFSSYLLIKGTSEYNTAEMAHFIDSVVQDAKDLGIETLPPDELERMKAGWNNEKHNAD